MSVEHVEVCKATEMSVEQPYGELVTSMLGVVTWNVWGRFGPYEQRQALIVDALALVHADVIVLQESWTTPGGASQAELLADRLGLKHWFVGEPGLDHGDWNTASAILSRWPIVESEHSPLSVPPDLRGWPGEVVKAVVDGPRGRVPVVGVSLDWPPQASALRRAAVADLARHCKELGRKEEFPVVVCGDFNAGPDSAELRSLTGEDPTAVPGFVLFDAWAKAGSGPGVTWDRTNRWAAPALLPSRRIDFILTGWPTEHGGAGDVIHAELVGDGSPDRPPSDHYGVSAHLRY